MVLASGSPKRGNLRNRKGRKGDVGGSQNFIALVVKKFVPIYASCLVRTESELSKFTSNSTYRSFVAHAVPALS